jgi:serine/threonine protein kinase
MKLLPEDRERLLRVNCANDEELFSDALVRLRCAEELSTSDFLKPLSPTFVAGILQENSEVGCMATIKSVGKYIVLKELGRGSFGSVYQACDRDTDRNVAIKLVRSDRASAFNEARVQAKFTHTSIVAIYEVAELPVVMTIGKPSMCLCLVMEYIEGSTLQRAISSGQLTPDRSVEIMRTVADAVAYAHLKGFSHRDLKPANILLDRDWNPKVSDFGVSVQFEKLNEETSVSGSPAYMSPERRKPEVTPTLEVTCGASVSFSMKC